MNKVVLIGRLGSDPETHWTASGAQIVTMRIATTDFYTDRSGNKVEQTEWHRVVAFQKTAAQCAQYLVKGRLVCVEGKIHTRKWQDPQGQDRTATEIRADIVRFLDAAGGRPSRTAAPSDEQTFNPSESEPFVSRSWEPLASSMDDIPF